jgi:hypothetical protein
MSEILTAPVILAAIGGFIVNILNLIELQNVPADRRPDFKDPLYWLPYIAWPLLGGLVGYLYNDAASPLGKFVSFHLGLSSPLILRTAASSIPAQAKPILQPGA